MTLVKNVNCVIDVSTSPGTMGELPVTWYDQDLNTAQVTIQIVRNGAPVMLLRQLAHPYLTLVPLDDSGTVFDVEMTIINEVNGVVRWTLRPDYELKHPGNYQAQLRLAVPSADQQVISVEFTFRLQQTLIERLSGSGKIVDQQQAMMGKLRAELMTLIDGRNKALQQRVDNIILGSSSGSDSAEVTASHADIFGQQYSSLTARLDAIERFQAQKGRD